VSEAGERERRVVGRSIPWGEDVGNMGLGGLDWVVWEGKIGGLESKEKEA
jgi:hypothetical protein